MNAILKFFPSVVEEGKKVIWPSRQTIMNHSLMVLITVTVAILVVAGVDYVFQQLLLLAVKG